ncbi:c-type cytochrome biogenesis protein CcmI [Yunchengibacter salinarum]|uniref:c-type cytochrome biogenesis protein CcmI n=1 Tax=Yunchengibacter salinarum TaxID=3133399 RepID=UPI0035B6924F
MIWAITFLMGAIAAGLMLIGIRFARQQDMRDDPVAHFRAQLDELDADEAAGKVAPDAAARARNEIKKRLLDVTSEGGPARTGARTSWPVLTGLSALILLGGLGLYALGGHPGMKAAPGERESMADQPVTQGGPSFRQAMADIRAHLADNPDDTEGWAILARTARGLGDYGLAARAFGALVRLEPDNTQWRVERLEAFLAMNDGKATPAARLVLDDLLARAPRHPAGRYYLGLVAEQDDRPERARDIWTGLLAESEPDAPWRPMVESRLSALNGDGPAPGISAQDRARVADMSPAEQRQFIDDMIGRLKARLANEPRNTEGWLMLARTHMARGEPDKARAVLDQALDSVAPENRPAIRQILDNLNKKPNS